ncbi:hypothetical protein BJ508DRAFT_414435 [Ascobolus immersus RN42]|uniref:Uncharacterized protein n=1 Tax=Ascobolus immersus RN42 TaxID=1160509 RepID=A0A3N4I914_ASCIM|nr:hypothetical protein BJ508DRAFT_414435 [Ascobolus immersus RN42]
MPAPSRSLSTSSCHSSNDNRLVPFTPRDVGIRGTDPGGTDQQVCHRNLAKAAASTAYKTDLQRRGSLVANSGPSAVPSSAHSSVPPSECDYDMSSKKYGTETRYGTDQNTTSTTNYSTISTGVIAEEPSLFTQSELSRPPPPSRRSSLRPPVNGLSPSTRTSFDDGSRQPSSYKRLKKARSVMIVATPTARNASTKIPLRAQKSESFLRGGQDFMPESLKRQQENKSSRPRLYRKASSFFQRIPTRRPSIAAFHSFQEPAVQKDQAEQLKSTKESHGSFRAIKKIGGTLIRSVRKKLGIQKPSRKPLQAPIQHIVSSREHYTIDPEDKGRPAFEVTREVESSTVRSVDPLFSQLAYDVATELLPADKERLDSIINEDFDGIRTSAANTWNTSAIMGTVGCEFHQRLSIIPEKRSSMPQADSIFMDDSPGQKDCAKIPRHEEALASLLENVAKQRAKMGLEEEDVVGKTRSPPELLDVKKRLAQSSTSSRRTHERKFSTFGTVLASESRKSSYSWSITDSSAPLGQHSPIIPGALEEQLTKLTEATNRLAMSAVAVNTKEKAEQTELDPLNRPTSSIYSRSTNGRSVSPQNRPYYHLIASPAPFDSSSTEVNQLDFASTQNYWASLQESTAKAIPPSPEKGNRLKVKRRNIYYYGAENSTCVKTNENNILRSPTPRPRIPLGKASLATLNANDSCITLKASRSVVSFRTEEPPAKRLPLGRRVGAENWNEGCEKNDSNAKKGYIGMRNCAGNDSVGSICFL